MQIITFTSARKTHGVKVDGNGKTYFNNSVYDKNGNEILAGGGGGGAWYQHESGSEVFIGPGYGDTPSDTNNLVLKINDDSNTKIDIDSNYVDIVGHCGVTIGPSDATTELNVYSETYFNSSVYDMNGDEILGGAGPLYNYDGLRVWIGPNENDTHLDSFAVKVGNYNSEKEYINAGEYNNLYLYGPTRVYIGPNTNNEKADDVFIDVQNKIKLTVDDLSLELDKTKLQKLIDLLNQ